MPDHKDLVQKYINQFFDISPNFPKARKFLKFWEDNIEGPLHSVRIGHKKYFVGRELRHAECIYTLH